MSGAHRTEQQSPEDSDESGFLRERLERTITLKALFVLMDGWLERSPIAGLNDELIGFSLQKAQSLLSEDRAPIHSGKALHARVIGLARSNAAFAKYVAQFEKMIATCLLSRLELKHLTVSELETLRMIVIEPVVRLGMDIKGDKQDTWQVIEALCLIMDSRIHNEKDILAKMDRMKIPQFELMQRLLRRLLWDHLDYAQFRRVGYAFYIRLSSRQSKLGYGEYEYGEMLSYVYDFGSRSNVVYEFMAWKAANPLALSPSFEQALVRFFEFEGRGTLRDGKIRHTLLSSNNAPFNHLIRSIRLEQSGIVSRFFFKYGIKLSFSLALAAAVSIIAMLIYKHWIE